MSVVTTSRRGFLNERGDESGEAEDEKEEEGAELVLVQLPLVDEGEGEERRESCASESFPDEEELCEGDETCGVVDRGPSTEMEFLVCDE